MIVVGDGGEGEGGVGDGVVACVGVGVIFGVILVVGVVAEYFPVVDVAAVVAVAVAACCCCYCSVTVRKEKVADTLNTFFLYCFCCQ